MMEDKLRVLLEDREWRLNHLYWITGKEGQLVRFRMNWAQKELFDHLHTRNDVLKVRQLGISTFTALLILDLSLFCENHKSGIVDKVKEDAQDKLEKIKLAYELLDFVPDGATDVDLALAEIGAGIKQRVTVRKSQETLLVFSNRSSVKVGTSMRGGTLQLLHVSELGYVSAHHPKRAAEIRAGGMNAVSMDCCIIKESTHEGGKVGINYEMTRSAMELQGRVLSKLDYRFFFFSWVDHPEYRLEGVKPVLNDELVEYFDEIGRLGFVLDDAQKAWYAAQWRVYHYATRQEYPTTPEEAFELPIEGAIYGKAISALRAKGLVNCVFEVDALAPLFTFWDIGLADQTSLWVGQRVGQRFHILDHYQGSELPVNHYVSKVREWEASYGAIAFHLLPHDSTTRHLQGDSLMSFEDFLRKGGISNVKRVKRTPDVWAGIHAVRLLLPHCVFHRRCSEPVFADGVEFPSGVSCLENYHTRRPNVIDHDVYSHSADAFRMLAEGAEQGLIQGGQMLSGRKMVQVKTGRGAGWRR